MLAGAPLYSSTVNFNIGACGYRESEIHIKAFYYTFLALNYWLTKFEPTNQDLITIS